MDRTCETCKAPSLEKYCSFECDPASRTYIEAKLMAQIAILAEKHKDDVHYLMALNDVQLFLNLSLTDILNV